MKYILKYWPLAAIILAFLAGNFIGDSSSDKELKEKFEQERQRDREAIGVLLDKITVLNDRSRTIEAERIQDSLRFADALERNKRAYTALKKKYNEINLNRATHTELDSVLSILYPD